MPVRDNLRKSTCVKSVDDRAAESVTSNQRVIGTYQSISALNNVGRFVPGLYRSNPVVIERLTGYSSPMSSTYKWSFEGRNYTTRLTGDWAAYQMAFMQTYWPIQLHAAWDQLRANVALTKVYSKMNTPDLDVGTILGELRETLAGLGSPMSALKDFLYPLKRGSKGRSLRQYLDLGSGSWLEFRYGIMPLIKTIDDVISYADSQIRNLCGKMLRKRSKVVWQNVYKQNLGMFYPSYDGAMGVCSHYVWPERTCTVKSKVVASLFYQIPRPPSLVERLGLTWADLPSVAWELMLLSFVWDWFIGVGDWLRSMKVELNRVVLGITVSQKTVVEAVCRIGHLRRAYPSNFPVIAESEAILTYERLERRIDQTKPVLPPVKLEALSLLRTIDSITLLWQRMPRLNWR